MEGSLQIERTSVVQIKDTSMQIRVFALYNNVLQMRVTPSLNNEVNERITLNIYTLCNDNSF